MAQKWFCFPTTSQNQWPNPDHPPEGYSQAVVGCQSSHPTRSGLGHKPNKIRFGAQTQQDQVWGSVCGKPTRLNLCSALARNSNKTRQTKRIETLCESSMIGNPSSFFLLSNVGSPTVQYWCNTLSHDMCIGITEC